jgi:hypothetical protein
MNGNFKSNRDRNRGASRSGQALTELIVALVVLLVLVAGIIQISLLGILQTRTMTEARRQAGAKAMLEVSSFSGPEFIADREAGADQTRYSRDDGFSGGDLVAFQSGIVDYSRPADLNQQLPDNAFSELAISSLPQLQFGLVEGESRATLPLLPIIRTLLYSANEVEVLGKAWLTWTKGIY